MLQELVRRLFFFMPENHPLRVFISYSHDSKEHAKRVLELSDRLRAEGIDCNIDQYEPSPPEDWPRWMINQIEGADYVLLVCTAIYYHRFRGKEKAGIGKGVTWEGAIIISELYHSQPKNTKFIPILSASSDGKYIPEPLRGATRYVFSIEDDYEALYRQLTNQPKVRKTELGKLKSLPNLSRKQEFFPIWVVPHPRNPFFTGREKIVNTVYNRLKKDSGLALTQAPAISGLGGIGKTQIALEYAYQYRNQYKAVFWVAAENESDIKTDFIKIANELNLPEKKAEDQNEMITGVKRWLQSNSDWLIIFDNVEDFHLVNQHVPSNSKGQLLFTTRLHATGQFAESISINKMEEAEGILFLLRRAKVISADLSVDDITLEYRDQAKEIYDLLDGLPLALDQAAAFIEEVPYSVKDYIDLYNSEGEALRKRRGKLTRDHRESVTITFQLAFDRLESANTNAANILRLCAFLAPDTIPEEILATIIKNSLQLVEAIEEICRFSLLSRDVDNKTYSVHRLIQDVLRDTMDSETQRVWAERSIHIINELFPEVKFENWLLYERLLPHAKWSTKLTKKFKYKFEEIPSLLDKVGSYLVERGGDYWEAKTFYKRALSIKKASFGEDHPNVATTLHNLGRLYCIHGRYSEAETFYKRALSIKKASFGEDHLNIATTLSSLAVVYTSQEKYSKAERLCRRALSIKETVLGKDHPETSTTLNNLALVYYNKRKYSKAETLYLRDLTISEAFWGKNHPSVATTLNNLALLYYDQRKYSKAESLYQRALAIRENIFGKDHPDVGIILNSLAALYHDQEKYSKAENLYQRALAIYEATLSEQHREVITTIENYAVLLRDTNRQTEAKILERRAKGVRDKKQNLLTRLRRLFNLHT